MNPMKVTATSGPDGSLDLRIPVGRAGVEYEAEVTLKVKRETSSWPPGYFDLAGSIDDETFIRHPQGELPKPVELD